MAKIDYLKIKSDNGYIIRAKVLFNKYLIISTEFDPFQHEYFYSLVTKLEIVKRLEVIHRYDDGTGYLIFEIEKNIENHIVMLYIEGAFNLYFNWPWTNQLNMN